MKVSFFFCRVNCTEFNVFVENFTISLVDLFYLSPCQNSYFCVDIERVFLCYSTLFQGKNYVVIVSFLTSCFDFSL